MPTSCQCRRNRSSTRTLARTQIDELRIPFHGLCRWRKRMPMQKDQNPSVWETSVLLPAAVQEGGRVAQQVVVLFFFCVILRALQLFTACPCFGPVLPGIGSRILSLWKSVCRPCINLRALFLFPASVENTIKEKNQCVLKRLKKKKKNQ